MSNHPVVGISWYEAYAFTCWLTHLGHKEKKWLQPNMRFTLASEPEWEKAARGGLQLPENNCIATIDSLSMVRALNLRENPLPGRTYPWGEELTTNHCSYGGTRIGSTSTPGCFPLGVSPYGVQDLSGNVWEWTRSLFETAAYSKSGVEKWGDYEDLEVKDSRVLRGGSFNNSDLRCALRGPRLGNSPYYRGNDRGFRVVAPLVEPGNQ